MADWYYSQDGKRLGPISTAELKDLASSGKLTSANLVWKEGMADWLSAGAVKGLLAGSAPAEADDSERPRQRHGDLDDLGWPRSRRDDDDDDRPRRRRPRYDDDDFPRRRSRRPRERSDSSVLIIVLAIFGGVIVLGIGLVVLIAVAAKDAAPIGPPIAPAPLARFNDIPLPAGKASFNGSLTLNDPIDPVDGRCKSFSYAMVAGKSYTIDMRSKTLDPVLRLDDPDGNEVAYDDDGGGFPNARIVHTANRTGSYRIIATSVGEVTGQFDLQVTPSP